MISAVIFVALLSVVTSLFRIGLARLQRITADLKLLSMRNFRKPNAGCADTPVASPMHARLPMVKRTLIVAHRAAKQ